MSTSPNASKNVPDSIEELIGQYRDSTLLRISTAGSVDDGKSTLIGRLLHDTGNIYDDTLESVRSASKTRDVRSEDAGEVDFSLVTDGLKSEREQGITIDVAYRYFSTPKRKFILADTPGHEQYTRNMATGASNCNVAIILIDARKGVLTQTKRHSFICSLLGVKHFAIAVNKMDLVDYSQETFEKIQSDYRAFAQKLTGVSDIRFFPMSALQGDNVCRASENMPWYKGETFLSYLENVYIGGDRNFVDFRFPVQYVIRQSNEKRYYGGQVLSGSVKVGDELMVLPSGRRSRVHDISGLDGQERAFTPMSVGIALEDEIDISRGDMLVHPENQPHRESQLESMMVWMSETPLDPQKTYLVQHTSRVTKAKISEIKYRVDVNTLSREDTSSLQLNEIGRVSVKLQQPVFWDVYSRNRNTGSFILIDSDTLNTVAAGMMINRVPSSSRTRVEPDAQPVSNVVPETDYLSSTERAERTGHHGSTLWFSGLSGSGKSTIAKALEKRLTDEGLFCFSLDGDNLRFGLNKDLGFSARDRRENLRRAAEVCKLMNQAGFIVLAAFITPIEEDRKMIAEILGPSLQSVFVDTPLEVCEQRDPKGLYKKARSGEIAEFTGISSPFEKPEAPSLHIETENESVEESVEKAFNLVMQNIKRVTSGH